MELGITLEEIKYSQDAIVDALSLEGVAWEKNILLCLLAICNSHLVNYLHMSFVYFLPMWFINVTCVIYERE